MNFLPDYFLQNLKKIYTAEELEIIHNWFNTKKRKLSLRLNGIKTNIEKFEAELTEKWIVFEKIKWLENAYMLDELSEKDLQKMRMYNTWEVYLQWLASQLPVLFFDDLKWKTVLDVTSAPGWKTSQLASCMQNLWEITALELGQIRLEKLNYTLSRQWVTNTQVIKTDARSFQTDKKFDAILLDAPCSSEWRINLYYEKSYWFLSETNNKKNYKLQKAIINNVLQYLANWWEFIYSTCTLHPLENEAIVHFIISNFPELETCELDETILQSFRYKAAITKFWDTVYNKKVAHAVRILPSEKHEWFFIAKFFKKSPHHCGW